MPEIIAAKEHNLIKVFSDDYFFEIPLYQRPYAWTTEHVDELLDDLTEAMNRDPDSPYFLGSIVLVKNDNDPLSQVVDGQQRLTTLTILLCVLRDIASDPKMAQELDDFVHEVGSELKNTEDRFRLHVRERDRDFFEEHIQKEGGLERLLLLDTVKFSDSQKRMSENSKHLRQKLQERTDEERRGLANFVCRNCFLVVVSASDGDSAYRIFSVLNNRGLDLSPTDILKAHVIGKIAPDSQEAYTAQWEGIEEQLGRDHFRDLFAHIRMIYRKEKMRGTLQKEFQDYVLEELDSEKALEFVDNVLEPYSDVYETVSNASYESTKDPDRVNSLLRHLGRLDNFDWIPPAMVYFHIQIKEGQQDRLIKFTQDLERLAYGLFILRANVTDRINRYGRLLRAIEQRDDLFVESSPLQLSQDERARVLNRLNGEIYNQPRVPMPLLLRLDSTFAEVGASYQQPVISIEHVLPQHPAGDSQWLKWFPDDDERYYWTHRLANLVLLSRRKNTRASNLEFESKKQEYFLQNGTTTFALTTKVVAESNWTPKVLERRQQELIDGLKKEWRLG